MNQTTTSDQRKTVANAKGALKIPADQYREILGKVQRHLQGQQGSPNWETVEEALKSLGYQLTFWYVRRILRDLKKTYPPVADGATSVPAKAAHEPIPPGDYLKLRQKVQRQLEQAATYPSYTEVDAIAKTHGYNLSDWYLRRIYRELKQLQPKLWTVAGPHARGDSNLRVVKSRLTQQEIGLLRTLTESLDVNEDEVMSIILLVLSHAVTRQMLPLTQLLTLARSTTTDDVNTLNSILQALNLSAITKKPA